jgi:hypothetical protein
MSESLALIASWMHPASSTSQVWNIWRNSRSASSASKALISSKRAKRNHIHFFAGDEGEEASLDCAQSFQAFANDMS